MKGRSILGLMVSLAVLGAGSLVVLAQSQRHPTTAEMQRLRQELRQNIRSIQNDSQIADYIRDRRNQTELQNRESFASAWSRVDSAIAPFIGSWSGWEESIKIYPSNIRGRVCIIMTGEGYGSFTIGSVSNGQILTTNGQALFKEGNYLGIAGVYNNIPVNALKIPLHSPRPLERITQLSGITEPQQRNRIIQQFNAAGCTASLPQAPQIATGRSSSGQQTAAGRSANSNSGQQTATGRVSTPRHSYRNVRELGMAQFLRRNQELIAAQEKLQRAAQGQYDIVNIPTTDFLTKPFTYVGTSRCKPFLGCERDPVSYADYLSLKLKLKAQDKIFSDALKVLKEIDLYVAKLNNDNRSGGRDVSQRIVSNFNDFGRQYEQLTQRPSFTLENIGRALAYAFEETRVADLNFIETVAKTGGKLGSAFTDLDRLVEILNSPELSNPEALQERGRNLGRNLEYVVTIKQKLIEIKDAFLARDITALTDLNLSIASDTIKLIDSQDPRLSRSADAIKIREASLKIIERANFLKQSQLSGSLNGFDQAFLVAAQTSSTVEIIASALSFIAPGKPAVRKLADKTDAIRAVLFDSLEFTYKDYVRQQYELLRAYTNRNQLILSGFSSSINFSAQEVGQYLLISRTDVVNRRSDGTIAVSIDGVLYPP